MVNLFSDSTPVEEVKSFILDWFRKNRCDVGHVISEKHIYHMAIKWNPKQKNALEEAINELINEGLVENHKNGLALTEKGVEHIY